MKTAALRGGVFFEMEDDLEDIPLLHESTDNDLLLVFLNMEPGEVSLSLCCQDQTLSPVVCYPPIDTTQTRYTRLLTVAASMGLVVMEEDWLFLGWHGQQEVWAAFTRMNISLGSMPLVKILPKQIKDLVEHGKILTKGPSRGWDRDLATVGQSYRVPPWLYDLIDKIGLLQSDPDR